MSAIAAVFRPAGAPDAGDETAARRMLDAQRSRGAERVAVHAAAGAVLAVARHEWEMAAGFAGDVLVLAAGDVIVAADASLYYRDDLRRALAERGISASGPSASHLILDAYRAWGTALGSRLEGDFAFVVWDGARRLVTVARDFGGKRTLFSARAGDALILASTVSGVLAHPECPRGVDEGVVAATAAGLLAADRDTCYRAVKRFPAGFTLARGDGVDGEPERHWTPPPARDAGGAPFEQAADELRELLQRAVRERCAPAGTTSVWLSGGRDSPAVFGAGMAALRGAGSGAMLRPVSMSYPIGDPGREDELIADVAARWGAPVHWVRIADAPMFDRVRERAARRAEPFAHAFEMWLRALARGSREVGARVALDGMGGDQLFQVSDVYLADLLRAGHWARCVLDARARFSGAGTTRGRTRLSRWRRISAGILQWAVEPQLSPWLRRRLAQALGRAGSAYLERRPPPWMVPEFVRAHGLEERERMFTPLHKCGSFAAYETQWYLTHPYFPRVFGCVAEIALEEGVEVRSPLYDRRVIEFALARPRSERNGASGTKLLLRKAMEDLVPAPVLAPRIARTGVTSGYFASSMRGHLAELTADLERESRLARAGMIDAEKAARVAAGYLDGRGESLAGQLYLTLQAELWARGTGALGAAAAGMARPNAEAGDVPTVA